MVAAVDFGFLEIDIIIGQKQFYLFGGKEDNAPHGRKRNGIVFQPQAARLAAPVKFVCVKSVRLVIILVVDMFCLLLRIFKKVLFGYLKEPLVGCYPQVAVLIFDHAVR
ncbi:hypothetical protein D3C86_1314490 [compost metagenome]